MDNQNQHQPNDTRFSQEIDLVDIVVVIWRRKSTVIFLTIVSILIASALFVSGGNTKHNISAVVLVGNSTVKTEDGAFETRQLMKASVSKQLLDHALIPNEAIRVLALGMKVDPSTVLVTAEQEKDGSGSVVVISAKVTTENLEGMKTIIYGASDSIATIQNSYLKKTSLQTIANINKMKLSIELAQNQATLDDLKQPYITKQLLIEQNIAKASDEVLIEQNRALLKQELKNKQSRLSDVEARVQFEKIKLQMLLDLQPVLEERRNVLLKKIDALNASRIRLQEGATVDGVDTLYNLGMEALLAVDRRDDRLWTLLTEINNRLLLENPANIKIAQKALSALLEEVLYLQTSLSIAEQAINIFNVDRSYILRNLNEENKAAQVQLTGFDAGQVAKLKVLKEQLAGLELVLEQPTRSTVITQVVIKDEEGKSFLIYTLAGLFTGGFLGCFFALSLELLAKAKIRAVNSV